MAVAASLAPLLPLPAHSPHSHSWGNPYFLPSNHHWLGSNCPHLQSLQTALAVHVTLQFYPATIVLPLPLFQQHP